MEKWIKNHLHLSGVLGPLGKRMENVTSTMTSSCTPGEGIDAHFSYKCRPTCSNIFATQKGSKITIKTFLKNTILCQSFIQFNHVYNGFMDNELLLTIACLIHVVLLHMYLGNKLWCLIGREPITYRATNTHVPWLSDVQRCTLPWSFPPLVDFQRLVRNNRGFEGIVKNLFKLCNNVWGWQQNFEKRNNNVTKV